MTDCSVCKDFRLHIIMNYTNYTYEQHTGCAKNRGASRKAVILRGKVSGKCRMTAIADTGLRFRENQL